VSRRATQIEPDVGVDAVLEAGMDVNNDLLWLLKRAFYLGLHTLNDATSDHGVTTAQLGLMRLLAEQPGLSGADLARRLLITPQGAQLAVAALERSGFVERKQDPNHGRILRAYLSEEGRQVATACLADAVGAHQQFFDVLDPEEQATLRGLLLKLANQAPSGVDDHRPVG
jgi:DNA-binding MarR family transcriptional regulator